MRTEVLKNKKDKINQIKIHTLRIWVYLLGLWKCCLSSTPTAGRTHPPAARRLEEACCLSRTSEADVVDFVVGAVLVQQCGDGDAPSPRMGCHIIGCHLHSRTCCWPCCAASLYGKNRGQERDLSMMHIIDKNACFKHVWNNGEVKRKRTNFGQIGEGPKKVYLLIL